MNEPKLLAFLFVDKFSALMLFVFASTVKIQTLDAEKILKKTIKKFLVQNKHLNELFSMNKLRFDFETINHINNNNNIDKAIEKLFLVLSKTIVLFIFQYFLSHFHNLAHTYWLIITFVLIIFALMNGAHVFLKVFNISVKPKLVPNLLLRSNRAHAHTYEQFHKCEWEIMCIKSILFSTLPSIQSTTNCLMISGAEKS